MSEYTLTRGAFGPKVTGKLHTQRKAQDYSVRPRSDGTIEVLSSKSIGVFDPETREGILNIKGCYYPYLHPAMGAIRYTFPEDFVTLAREACLEPGGETTVGGVTIVNTVQVI